MSNYLVGIDQKSRPQWKQGRIRKAIGAALVIALASATILTTLQVKSAAAEINSARVEDHLVSPDMNEYMHKQGHGMVFNQMDMQ